MKKPPPPDTWLGQLHAALRAYHNAGGSPDDLLEAWQLANEARAHLAAKTPAVKRRATNEVLHLGLQILAERNQAHAQLLRERFVAKQKARVLARREGGSSIDYINRQQKQALHTLADILWEQELRARERQAQARVEALPAPTYTRLFGVADRLRRALTQLLAPVPPYVVAVVGIGGIGKTALADAVTRQAAQEQVFEKIHFLRMSAPDALKLNSSHPLAEQLAAGLARLLSPKLPDGLTQAQHWTAARQVLQEAPQLVVVDNLEADADVDEVFQRLGDVAGPSKFLLTSRARPAQPTATLFVSMDELSATEATQLLQHEADCAGLTDIARSPAAELSPIYEVVGGNPLALKLVLRLAQVQPLPSLLSDLRHSGPGAVEEMYRHIYQKAWDVLSEPARQVLLAVLLAAEGGATWDNVLASSGLTAPTLLGALGELNARCLLEARGTVWERRYGLHRLTETFLRSDLLGQLGLA